MDVDSQKMHLQSIEEYVLDEEKIVTYRWLSKVLNVHVNLSKELLSRFASDPSRENVVYLTYLISGKRKDGTYSVLVVGQDKFEEVKSDFDLVTSHHVYSVQKKKETPSASLLYMVNSEKIENEIDVAKKIGAIKCASSTQRSDDEILKLRLVSLGKEKCSDNVTLPKKPSQPPPASSPNKKKEVEKKEPAPAVNKSTDSKGKAATGGIAAMFAAQSSKPSNTTSSSTQSKAKPPAKKVGGINSFFSKVPKTENQPTPASLKSTENEDQEVTHMEVDISPKENSAKAKVESAKTEPSPKKQKEPSPKNKKEPSPRKTTAAKKSGKTSKSKAKSKPASKDKQRKRIKVIDSDSSDDMFEKERDSSPEPDRNSPPPPHKIEDSDEEIIPPTPQPEKETKHHRKRKVVRDKSYLDEDGYMVTEKETVYESCTDSEPENNGTVKKPKEDPPSSIPKENGKVTENAKDTSTKKPAKKNVSPVKNKQASLMSFFKKA